MSGSDLDKPTIREKLVESLGNSVKWHSNFDGSPLDLHLENPLPSKVRLYLYNLIPSSRDNEFKINVRLPGHDNGENHASPDRSGGYLSILGGYHESHDVFAFWDDDLYEEYGPVSSLQVHEDSVNDAVSDGFKPQQRSGGEGGETVIVATSDHVDDALQMRERLVQIRSILHDYLPSEWRDNSSRAQTIERVVDLFLEETSKGRPTTARREEAQQIVAEEQGVNIDTVQDKFRGQLWEDRDPGSQGYQREYLDPILEEIETVWRSKDTSTEDLLNEYVGPDHPLITHLQENRSTISAYTFSAPPDHWLTSVRYNAVSFSEEHREHWNNLSPGDIIFFYSQNDPANGELAEQSAGLIGAAILGNKYTKEGDRWWKEHEVDKDFPLVVKFRRVFYTGRIEGLDFNLETAITEKDSSVLEDELESLTVDLLEVSAAHSICHDVFDDRMPVEVPLADFSNDDGSTEIVRPKALVGAMASSLREAPPINIYTEFSDNIDHGVLDGLYFPGDEGVEILDQIEAALRAGEHIVLTGPPGTGKTAIANRVADALATDYPWQFSDSQVTTATADWSTFDTVGGYMPNERADTDTQLAFSAGIILNRFKDQRTSTQRNELVVIDELNRADIDKAFGQLFTVLSGQSVQLPYTRDSNEIEIVTADSLDHLPKSHQYVVPASWSIFATMNTYDKTSLYEMSYAFMRRFSFIPVGVPALPSQGDPDEDEQLTELMASYVASWDGIDPSRDEQLAVARVWRNTNNAVEERAIGPAIVKDILSNIIQYSTSEIEPRLTNAIISYIFPQLEGIPQRGQIVRSIAKAPDVNEEKLRTAAKEILQIPFSDDE